MEKAYVVLGISDLADVDEIKEAYRNKKRLYDPERFVEGSQEWHFACAKYGALDEAYRQAVAAASTKTHRRYRDENTDENADADESDYEQEPSFIKEAAVLLVVFPLAFYALQYAVPTVFSDVRRSVRLFDAAVLFLCYCFPLLLRFAVLRRPVAGFAAALALFPLTLLSADFLLSMFLFLLPGRRFVYVPSLYFTGWAIFLAVSAHCAILTLPPNAERNSVPFARRAGAYTLTLAVSAALSLSLSVAFNGRFFEKSDAAAAAQIQSEAPEKNWQALELQDAGTIEIPESWYVEDSNGKYTRIQAGGSVQHIREALTARPYGKREEGLDFAFELMVYWWTREDGRALPPPENVNAMLQEHQLESLRRNFPDAAVLSRSVSELEGRTTDSMTLEAYVSGQAGQVIRFKNILFRQGEKLYFLIVGYPAHEEKSWEAELNEILRRWSLERSNG